MPLRPRIGRFLRGHWASGLLAGPVRLPARRLALWYVRRWLKRKLKATLATVAIQLYLLAAAHAAVSLTGEALPARLAASGLVWALLLYNTTHLVFCTIPSAVRDSRWLRGWRAFFLRDVRALCGEFLRGRLRTFSTDSAPWHTCRRGW